MHHSSRLRISDLEATPSVFEQKLTVEEVEKVVGGTNSSNAISSSRFSLIASLKLSGSLELVLYNQLPDPNLQQLPPPLPPPPPPPPWHPTPTSTLTSALAGT